MTDKEKTIKELKEALDSLDITNKYRLNLIRAIEYLQEEPVSDVWHNTNEKPNYVEGDTYANSILVFGKTSLGYGASVGNMIDRDTIYSPMSRKEYKWGECPFTMWAYISDLLHKHEEPVSEGLEEASETISLELYPKNIKTYCGPLPGGEPFEVDDNILPRQGFVRGFKAGAEWQKENLWKSADGDDLPEIDREVIALLDNGKVVFAHRPPEYWDGKDIVTGKVTRYHPKTYGKGGWNIPDTKWWLDCLMPKEIEL